MNKILFKYLILIWLANFSHELTLRDGDTEEDEISYTILNKWRSEEGQTINLFLSATPLQNSDLGDVITGTRDVAHSNNSHWQTNQVQDGGDTLYTLTPNENKENRVTKRMTSDRSIVMAKYKLNKYSDALGYYIQRHDQTNGDSDLPVCMVNEGPGKVVSFKNCCYACKNDKVPFLWRFHPYPWNWLSKPGLPMKI